MPGNREPDCSQFEVQVSNSTSLEIDNNRIAIRATTTWRSVPFHQKVRSQNSTFNPRDLPHRFTFSRMVRLQRVRSLIRALLLSWKIPSRTSTELRRIQEVRNTHLHRFCSPGGNILTYLSLDIQGTCCSSGCRRHDPVMLSSTFDAQYLCCMTLPSSKARTLLTYLDLAPTPFCRRPSGNPTARSVARRVTSTEGDEEGAEARPGASRATFEGLRNWMKMSHPYLKIERLPRA